MRESEHSGKKKEPGRTEGDGRVIKILLLLCFHSSLRLLVEWGGQASPQDSQGETPLFLALCEGHCQCIDVLLEAGSSLQVVTTVSDPLHAPFVTQTYMYT